MVEKEDTFSNMGESPKSFHMTVIHRTKREREEKYEKIKGHTKSIH
jgi:hypothetical protein